MRKRIVSLVLCCVLIFMAFSCAMIQPAKAVTTAVIAGAVVAVMALAGVSIVATGMTAAQVQAWVEEEIEKYVAVRPENTVDEVFHTAGIGTTLSGLFILGKATVDAINGFVENLRFHYQLQNNSEKQVYHDGTQEITLLPHIAEYTYSTVQVAGLYVGEFMLYGPGEGTNPKLFLGTNATTNDVYVGFYEVTDSNGWPYLRSVFFCDNPGRSAYYGYVNNNNSRQIDIVQTINGQTFYYREQAGQPFMSFANGIESFDTLDQVIAKYLDRENLGGNDKDLTLKTGVIEGVTVGEGENVYVNVGAAAGSSAQEVADTVFDDVASDTLTVSGSVATEEPPLTITGPVSVSGLDDIFPFCIPFDLYHFLEVLAAEPVAPSFEWHFVVPQLNLDEEIEIDLSPFNTVAVVLRTMEMLLFAVGLAFETRKILRS